MGKLIDLDRLSRFKDKLPGLIHNEALTKKESISSGADLDTYVTPGIYVCEQNSIAAQVLNTPNNGQSAFTLIVLPNATDTLFKQFCYYYNTNYVYMRRKNSTGWQPWQRFASTDEIDKTHQNIALLENSNTATHNITKGQFVVWNGTLYTAKNDISSGTTLSTSNLSSVSGGGLNNLNTKIDTTNTEIETIKDNLWRFAYVGSAGGATAKTYTKDLPTGAALYLITTYHYTGSDTDVMGLYLLHVAGSTTTATAVAFLPIKAITHSSSSLSAAVENGVPVLTFTAGRSDSYAIIYKLA